MRTIVLTLTLLVSVVCASKNGQNYIAPKMASNEVLLLKNMQSAEVSVAGVSDVGPGKPVKILTITVEGFKKTQQQQATAEEVETVLEDFYKVDIRKEDLKPLVDVLNKKDAAKQSFKINAYEKQNSDTQSAKGGIVGGNNQCDPSTKLATIQKILDALNGWDIIEPWKIHIHQIIDCKTQVVQGLRYLFKIKLGLQTCPFNVIADPDSVHFTMVEPEDLFFACPQILKPSFQSSFQRTIKEALQSSSKKTDIKLTTAKLEGDDDDEEQPKMPKTGAKYECAAEKKMEIARNIVEELDKQKTLRNFDLKWENVLTCVKQTTRIQNTDITVNVDGVACEISVSHSNQKIVFENAEDVFNHCGKLLRSDYKPSTENQIPALNHDATNENQQGGKIVGGPIPCPDSTLETDVNGYLDKLENRYFKPLFVKKADISACTTQVVTGTKATFTIAVSKKQCQIEMMVNAVPAILINAKQLFKDCPDLFVKGFNPDKNNFVRNLAV